MKYAIALGMMSFALFVGSGFYPTVGWLLIWAGVSFGWIALGYAGMGPRVFRKTSSGRIPLAWKVLNLPYLSMTWLVWHAVRLLSREEAFNTIDANLVIGRRLLASEAPDGFDHYVDLTAEFEEPAPIRIRPGYRCLPILDAAVPAIEELREAVESSVNGRVFVHCAQGHGRTGLFALALLLRRGRVQTVEEGVGLLRSLRPAVRLNRVQLAFAHRYLETNAERIAPNDL
ncbi:MAG: Protein-tyrosine phosphatase [Verrucomicrobia bacterium]|nr:MAG: Protein-tyrosine phosphatase [Verrucomicrobiota bacterium]